LIISSSRTVGTNTGSVNTSVNILKYLLYLCRFLTVIFTEFVKNALISPLSRCLCLGQTICLPTIRHSSELSLVKEGNISRQMIHLSDDIIYRRDISIVQLLWTCSVYHRVSHYSSPGTVLILVHLLHNCSGHHLYSTLQQYFQFSNLQVFHKLPHLYIISLMKYAH
jgi:hypothetical protein